MSSLWSRILRAKYACSHHRRSKTTFRNYVFSVRCFVSFQTYFQQTQIRVCVLSQCFASMNAGFHRLKISKSPSGISYDIHIIIQHVRVTSQTFKNSHIHWSPAAATKNSKYLRNALYRVGIPKYLCAYVAMIAKCIHI